MGSISVTVCNLLIEGDLIFRVPNVFPVQRHRLRITHVDGARAHRSVVAEGAGYVRVGESHAVSRSLGAVYKGSRKAARAKTTVCGTGRAGTHGDVHIYNLLAARGIAEAGVRAGDINGHAVQLG